eukprot:scpid75329/ scgid30281/ 
MADPMKIVGTPVPSTPKYFLSDVLDKLEELLGSFKDIVFPKRAKAQAEDAKLHVTNMCCIANRVLDLTCELAFQLHRAGHAGKATTTDRRRAQNEIVNAIREGRRDQDPVASYIRDLKDRRDKLLTELKKLDSEDENSYISKTSRALQTLYDATSRADSHFWTRHPRKTAAFVGAVIGGGIAIAIAVPLIGWVTAVVGWTLCGMAVGGTVGAVGAHCIVNTPAISPIELLGRINQQFSLLKLNTREYSFLDHTYDANSLVIALEDKWRDLSDDLEDAIRGYPTIRQNIRRLRAAF